MSEEKNEQPQDEIKTELKEITPDVVKIQAFDEKTIDAMKIMQEQNNIYANLRGTEEKIRININSLRKAIHDIKKMRPEELRTIAVPYLNGLKFMTPDRRNEFIKTNIEMYNVFDNEYQSIKGQRLHRGDELGEARMVVLKKLWGVLIRQHGFKHEDLCDMLRIPEGENLFWNRKQEVIPKADDVKPAAGS